MKHENGQKLATFRILS